MQGRVLVGKYLPFSSGPLFLRGTELKMVRLVPQLEDAGGALDDELAGDDGTVLDMEAVALLVYPRAFEQLIPNTSVAMNEYCDESTLYCSIYAHIGVVGMLRLRAFERHQYHYERSNHDHILIR